MEDEKKPTASPGMFDHLFFEKDPEAPPAKCVRPKRRRKGQLNDGQWAPGYGPNKPIKD